MKKVLFSVISQQATMVFADKVGNDQDAANKYYRGDDTGYDSPDYSGCSLLCGSSRLFPRWNIRRRLFDGRNVRSIAPLEFRSNLIFFPQCDRQRKRSRCGLWFDSKRRHFRSYRITEIPFYPTVHYHIISGGNVCQLNIIIVLQHDTECPAGEQGGRLPQGGN